MRVAVAATAPAKPKPAPVVAVCDKLSLTSVPAELPLPCETRVFITPLSASIGTHFCERAMADAALSCLQVLLLWATLLQVLSLWSTRVATAAIAPSKSKATPIVAGPVSYFACQVPC
jgi:hypothetical protein